MVVGRVEDDSSSDASYPDLRLSRFDAGLQSRLILNRLRRWILRLSS